MGKPSKKKDYRLQYEYERYGMRKIVEGILLVHEHSTPHVLLLQKGPGGELEPGEDEQLGMKRLLDEMIGDKERKTDWAVKDVLGVWYRPNFEHNRFPYLPAHVTKPKETVKHFLIQLPRKAMFAVPSNIKMVAAPFFELFDNRETYGVVISTLPQMISRYVFNYRLEAADEEDEF